LAYYGCTTVQTDALRDSIWIQVTTFVTVTYTLGRLYIQALLVPQSRECVEVCKYILQVPKGYTVAQNTVNPSPDGNLVSHRSYV
jgi:hypothetical protein